MSELTKTEALGISLSITRSKMVEILQEISGLYNIHITEINYSNTEKEEKCSITYKSVFGYKRIKITWEKELNTFYEDQEIYEKETLNFKM